MNIFVVDENPIISAISLPDRHIIKMPIECAQMISIIMSSWYLNIGDLPKENGQMYKTKAGAFRNHPCTRWAASNYDNLTWLLEHGLALCDEFVYRFGKKHGAEYSLKYAATVLPKGNSSFCKSFVRAMDDVFKYDMTISDVEAYRRYVASKKWTLTNYIKKPERQPEWIKKYIL